MGLEVSNIEQIKKALAGLTPALKNKILKNALQKISNPILKSAENKIWTHQRSGRLYRSLGQKITKLDGSIAIVLGAKNTGAFKGSYAHLLENDTKERSYITKKGVVHKTGKVKGINFWSSSIEETSKQSESEFQNYIILAMEKEVDSLNRKSSK